MKKYLKYLLLLVSLFSSSIFACDGIAQKMEMAKSLYQDQEFLDFACGVTGCSLEEFETHLEYKKEPIVKDRDIFACFVKAISSAKNIYTGFFIAEDHKILPQFIFFGTSIQTTGKIRHGHRTVVGAELIEAGVSEKYEYVWNGKAYVYMENQKLKIPY